LYLKKLVGQGAHRADVKHTRRRTRQSSTRSKVGADPGLESPLTKLISATPTISSHTRAHIPQRHAAVHIPSIRCEAVSAGWLNFRSRKRCCSTRIHTPRSCSLHSPPCRTRDQSRDVNQQQLKQVLRRFAPRGVGVHHHTVGGRRGAGRTKPPFICSTSTHAHAARPKGIRRLCSKKVGIKIPQPPRLEDGGPIRYLYFRSSMVKTNHNTPSTSMVSLFNKYNIGAVDLSGYIDMACAVLKVLNIFL